MTETEKKIMRDWHYDEHSGAYQMCQGHPCVDLRRLTNPDSTRRKETS